MTYVLSALCVILLIVVILQWKTYRTVAGPDLQPGDIVLYVNPGADDPLNNMITQVLDIHGDGVGLRVRGNTLKGSTTGGAKKKYLTRLPVDQHHHLQVPTRPIPNGSGEKTTNAAVWMEIPLKWFPYVIWRKDWEQREVAS